MAVELGPKVQGPEVGAGQASEDEFDTEEFDEEKDLMMEEELDVEEGFDIIEELVIEDPDLCGLGLRTAVELFMLDVGLALEFELMLLIDAEIFEKEEPGAGEAKLCAPVEILGLDVDLVLIFKPVLMDTSMSVLEDK